MREDLSKVVEQYNKNGWVPVPYQNQDARVREAIKAARFRPAIKQCFANSQRLLTQQTLYEFEYVEGIIESVIPIQHAWLELDGQRVDVTLPHLPNIVCSYKVPKDQVYLNMIKTKAYGPVMWERLAVLQNLTMVGKSTYGSDEELRERWNEVLQQLNGPKKTA